MNLSEEDIKLIDGYLRNELSQTDINQFHERMKNKYFIEELNYRKDLMIAARSLLKDERKWMLQQEEMGLNKATSISKHIRYNIKWLWAILITVSIVVAYLFYRNSSNNRIEAPGLIAEYFEPFPNVINPIKMSSVEEVLDPFQLYEQQSYKEAISVFSEKAELTESEEFYLGLCYFYNENDDPALNILDKISNNPSHRFYQASEWFLAGILIKSDRIDEGKDLLQNIINEANHPFSLKAKELLNNF